MSMGVITIERKILAKNDACAEENRALLRSHRIFSVNIVSSPGAGKTSLLELLLDEMQGRIPCAVIEGDLQTDLDAQRIARHGVPAVQIVTRGGCHLDAPLVRDAMGHLALDSLRLLIIENVGNLVCPANYDLGEDLKIVVVSTTEGDDKPLKYPEMFHRASVLVINKTDLLPYTGSDADLLESNARRINPGLQVFRTSCRTGDGIPLFAEWIAQEVQKRQ